MRENERLRNARSAAFDLARYPGGNTGGAEVDAFLPMPIPADLRDILEGRHAQEVIR